jgi:hypothetical protein
LLLLEIKKKKYETIHAYPIFAVAFIPLWNAGTGEAFAMDT